MTTDMKPPDKCPYCGAPRSDASLRPLRYRRYECDSLPLRGKALQSDGCRANVAEAKVEKLRALLQEFVETPPWRAGGYNQAADLICQWCCVTDNILLHGRRGHTPPEHKPHCLWRRAMEALG